MANVEVFAVATINQCAKFRTSLADRTPREMGTCEIALYWARRSQCNVGKKFTTAGCSRGNYEAYAVYICLEHPNVNTNIVNVKIYGY